MDPKQLKKQKAAARQVAAERLVAQRTRSTAAAPSSAWGGATSSDGRGAGEGASAGALDGEAGARAPLSRKAAADAELLQFRCATPAQGLSVHLCCTIQQMQGCFSIDLHLPHMFCHSAASGRSSRAASVHRVPTCSSCSAAAHLLHQVAGASLLQVCRGCSCPASRHSWPLMQCCSTQVCMDCLLLYQGKAYRPLWALKMA